MKLRAKVTVNSALNTRNGPNTEALRKLTIGDKVLIYREHVKAQTGPHPFVSLHDENLTADVNGRHAVFRTTVYKPWYDDHSTQEP